LGAVTGLEVAMLIPFRPGGFDWRWDGLPTTSVPLIASAALGAFAQWASELARRRCARWKYLVVLGVTAVAFAWAMTAEFPKALLQRSYEEWMSSAALAAAAIGLAGAMWTRSATLALAALILGLQVGWEGAEIGFFVPGTSIWSWMRLFCSELVAPLSVAGVSGVALGWGVNRLLRRSTDEGETEPG
jgi:hypothetical protein